MPDTTTIKAAKAELLETAGKAKPPQEFVDQDDIMDMMLREYFNPVSRVPHEKTLRALTAAAQTCKADAEISEAQVKAILDKFRPA